MAIEENECCNAQPLQDCIGTRRQPGCPDHLTQILE